MGKTDLPDKELGITQGSSLSPLLANLYLSDFDSVLKSAFGDRFIRYVDDFVVMCKTKEEAEIAKKLALQEIAKIDLQLSPDGPDTKTYIKNLISSEAIDFLGVSIQRRCLIPKGGLEEAKKRMREIIQWRDDKGRDQYKKSINRNGKIMDVTDQIEEKIRSWGEHYRFYHVEKLYTDLDKYIVERTMLMKDVRPIEPLKTIKLDPINSIEEWNSLFIS